MTTALLKRLFDTLPRLAIAVGAPVEPWWAEISAHLPPYTTVDMQVRCQLDRNKGNCYNGTTWLMADNREPTSHVGYNWYQWLVGVSNFHSRAALVPAATCRDGVLCLVPTATANLTPHCIFNRRLGQHGLSFQQRLWMLGRSLILQTRHART